MKHVVGVYIPRVEAGTCIAVCAGVAMGVFFTVPGVFLLLAGIVRGCVRNPGLLLMMRMMMRRKMNQVQIWRGKEKNMMMAINNTNP